MVFPMFEQGLVTIKDGTYLNTSIDKNKKLNI